jgi:hypothetical protein
VTRRRLLVLVGLLALVAGAAAVVGVLLLDHKDDPPFGGVSGDMRTALDSLQPDELPTLEIANQPGWLHRADAPESNYQAVWIFANSPTTPYQSPDAAQQEGRYLLLDPRHRDSAGRAGHDEWWFVIERYWPSSYPASNHGRWGRTVNFHNVAGDAGAQENENGGVGWSFGVGTSSLGLDWLPGRPTPTISIEPQPDGQNMALPPVERDRWHTYVIHFVAGRTDGSTLRPGSITVWVDGADAPAIRRPDINTVQRAEGPDGQLYTQRWMQLWEGDYTSALPVEARQRLVLTRIGRTLEEAVADRPRLIGTTLGDYYRVSGDAPRPSVTVVSSGRKVTDAQIPPSLADEAGTVG